MKRLIAGASGFIGQHLVQHWLKQAPLILVSRDEEKLKAQFKKPLDRIEIVHWNKLTVEHLAQCEVVVNLAGSNIAAGRWNEKNKQRIVSSRVTTTEKLSQLAASLASEAPALFCASGIGIYGSQKKVVSPAQAFSENHQVPNNPSFLQQVGLAWEQAAHAAKQAQVRVCHLRFGAVLDPSGGALAKMILPFKLGLGGPIGQGSQPFAWVSLRDVLAVFDFLLQQKTLSGPINVVAPQITSQQQFARALAKSLHRPAWLTTPAFVMKLLLGQMAEELILSGQCAQPKRLLQHKFDFQDRHIESALQRMLK